MTRLAIAAYDVGFLGSWPTFEQKLTRWVTAAADAGAELLVFPEYAAMELASVFDETVYTDLLRQRHALQSVLPDFITLHERLAREFGVVIVAGSFPVAVAPERFRNRAYVCTPDGATDYQEKIVMTRFENERWLIEGGNTLKVFDTRVATFAINICYDAEFPLLAHQQVAAGANLILVPSCTDTRAGYERVRLGCRARALENQCFVAHASLLGSAAWSPAIDVNTGAAGVYAPLDYGFPDNGVINERALDAPGWLHQDIDPDGLAEVRRTGQVFNYRDWDRQCGVHTETVKM